uniref:Platelet glycoprotein 4 n=1 Tax=Naja naja TaxID=35670 RepID=A0A8C6Y7Q2_NAJNA
MGCNRNCGLLTGAIIGAVLAILGGILIPVGNNLIEDTVKKETVLENGTTAYENWVIPGSPIYQQFWLFDVQNPEEVMKNGSAPILKEKGPYTYKTRYMPKVNITEHDDATLSYFLENIVLFQPDMSSGLESDKITTVNLAVVIAPVLYPDAAPLLNMFIQQSKSKLLQIRTVKEILWGYEDPFLKLIPLPNIDNIVGVFYPFNKTFDGPYRIYSGKDDINKVGIIQSYKNNRYTTFGGDTAVFIYFFPPNFPTVQYAASFHPFVDKSEKLGFFSSEVCRSIFATFESEETVKEIRLYRFVIPLSSFESPVNNPDNICFCTDMETSQNCTLDGILDLSSCKGGKPVYITLPHFLHANEQLFHHVEGMKPVEEEHKSFLDVEPVSDCKLNSYAFKVLVTTYKELYAFPVLWLNETAIIGDEKAELFRSTVTDKIKLLNIVQIVLITLGSVMFLGFFIAFCVCRKKSSK